MQEKITPDQIGERYGLAVERMIEVIVNYSEDQLYNPDGSPRVDPGEVSRAVDGMITQLRHEASLIKDTVFEAYEANADESQAELF
tara:strand:- start:207 stop:464 length:258 start_codon:yes stop_codon:yes gene_type:complete